MLPAPRPSPLIAAICAWNSWPMCSWDRPPWIHARALLETGDGLGEDDVTGQPLSPIAGSLISSCLAEITAAPRAADRRAGARSALPRSSPSPARRWRAGAARSLCQHSAAARASRRTRRTIAFIMTPPVSRNHQSRRNRRRDLAMRVPATLMRVSMTGGNYTGHAARPVLGLLSRRSSARSPPSPWKGRRGPCPSVSGCWIS